MNHIDKADTFPVDATFADVRPGDFAAIVLPGGVANPDRLRTNPRPLSGSGPSSIPAGRRPSSATPPGPWSRPMWFGAGR
jgi:protease I